jgi:hypothetical protein
LALLFNDLFKPFICLLLVKIKKKKRLAWLPLGGGFCVAIYAPSDLK